MRTAVQLALVLVAGLVLGCGSSRSTQVVPAEKGLDVVDAIREAFNRLQQNGVSLSLNGELIANLASPSTVVSSYGTVTQGTTLNYLNSGSLDFIVYGNDGVFAAECETSADRPDFGRSHPLCEIYGAENYDRIIVCFAAKVGADIVRAQNWPGSSAAFDDGRGLVCYVDGLKMKSTHVFTY